MSRRYSSPHSTMAIGGAILVFFAVWSGTFYGMGTLGFLDAPFAFLALYAIPGLTAYAWYGVFVDKEWRKEEKRRKLAEALASEQRKLTETEEQRKRAEEQERIDRYRIDRYRQEQERIRTQIVTLGDQSLGVFESMPELVRTAESQLDLAESEFADSAFAPFWDSIEKAANALANFDAKVRSIEDLSARYIELIRNYEGTPPAFPLAPHSVAKLSVANRTAERMKTLVRNAQRNFQFAMIYEQRKTNQLLVGGFISLAQALDRMTTQITTSLTNLTLAVDGLAATVTESVGAVHSRLGDVMDMATEHHQALEKEGFERAAREEKVLEMLDNIQHRKEPLV